MEILSLSRVNTSMRDLYNTLTDVLGDAGFNLAPFGEDSFQMADRSIRLEMGEKNPLAPSFDMYSATFTVTFLNGFSWA